MTSPGELRCLESALRTGELSPTEHVSDVLERLRTDPHNAVVVLDEERALREAAARTDELARGGRRGPLHGIAVGVKDLIDVAGVPTRAGSDVLADAPPATADAAVVAQLKRCGAIVVAKLHTHEFGHGPTGDVSATGPALNPHDRTRITGGSSSGPAAAVAAGHLPLALGTDTGGSVRIPAALCGVVGLKPSFGALSTRGVFPLAESFDHVGLIAADLRATAIAWEQLNGPSDIDTPCQQVDGCRVGVLRGDYWAAADRVIDAAVGAAVEALCHRGALVAPVGIPMIDELAATYLPILGAEAYAIHAAFLAERPEAYQRDTAVGLGLFAAQPAAEYAAALRERHRLARSLYAAVADLDALLLPTTRLRATPIGEPFGNVGGRVESVGHALLELTMPFNLTGWPAVSIPAPVEGLPVGLQLVGVRADEHALLRLAAAITTR